jgi:hypothetical protein
MPGTELIEAEVNNHDVSGLCNRIARFATEVHLSVSSRMSHYHSDDIARLESYFKSMKDYKTWIISQPILDIPSSTPRIIKIRDVFKEMAHTDNEDVNDIIQMLWLTYNELAIGQSARAGSGLHPNDQARFDRLIGKLESFLENYVKQNNPLDMPETSPHAESTGHGSTGI